MPREKKYKGEEKKYEQQTRRSRMLFIGLHPRVTLGVTRKYVGRNASFMHTMGVPSLTLGVVRIGLLHSELRVVLRGSLSDHTRPKYVGHTQRLCGAYPSDQMGKSRIRILSEYIIKFI